MRDDALQVGPQSTGLRDFGLRLGDAVELDEIKVEDLPENMREMSLEQRQAYVESQARRRAEIQQDINDLNATRMAYVAEQLERFSAEGADTLDSAMIESLREQAEQKNFEFESSTPDAATESAGN